LLSLSLLEIAIRLLCIHASRKPSEVTYLCRPHIQQDSMPAIAILTATSRTGLELIQLGLSRDLTVHAVVRSAAKLRSQLPSHILSSPLLQVHEVDVSDPASLTPAIGAADKIFITCVGPQLDHPTFVIHNAVASVLACIAALPHAPAPEKHIVLLSAVLTNPAAARARPVAAAVASSLLHSVSQDLGLAEGLLRRNAALVWYTIVQPAAIVEAPATGAWEIRDMTDGRPIAYADLAAAMLHVAVGEDDKWINTCMAPVSLKPPKPGLKGMRTQIAMLRWAVWAKVVRPLAGSVALMGLGYILGRRFVMGSGLERRVLDRLEGVFASR
jgi:hypothetical protein